MFVDEPEEFVFQFRTARVIFREYVKLVEQFNDALFVVLALRRGWFQRHQHGIVSSLSLKYLLASVGFTSSARL